MADWRSFWILFVRNLSMGYSCVRPYILFYIQAILLFWRLRKYYKITQIQNDCQTAILKLFAYKN